MRDQRSADILAVVIENCELHQQLAGVQNQCIHAVRDQILQRR